MRPPVPGMHGRHRVFDTPGPTGLNDHGDPSHARQAGPTPGSLGVNDHGTPLPPPAPLLLPERRRDIEDHINRFVEEANATGHPQTEQRLQASLDAAKNRDKVGRSQDEAGRCAEAYFYARLNALQGKSTVTKGQQQAPWRSAVPDRRRRRRARGHLLSITPTSLRSSSRVARLEPCEKGSGRPNQGRDAELATSDSTRIGSRGAPRTACATDPTPP